MEKLLEPFGKLKAAIIQDANDGVDFGCACYYCGATPIDLVNRGDAIPVIYEMGELICFRCTEGGYYVEHSHIKDISKKIALLRAYSKTGSDDAFRNIEIERLSQLLLDEDHK